MQDSKDSFFTYQIMRLNWLLGWGSANVASGLLGLVTKKEVTRNFWFMNAGWGIINALLAWNGQRVARHKAARHNENPAITKEEAAKMRTLLLVNVPLDVIYVLSGIWLVRSKKAKWRGAGISIIFQGIWLFGYDFLLARDIQKRWLND
jgi:hypothetical protein